MDVLKLGYELDQLSDLVEERTRLVSVLKLAPTSNDNVTLKRQLGSILELLQKCAPNDELISRYNTILDKIPDTAVDKELYRFQQQVARNTDEVSKESLKKCGSRMMTSLRSCIRMTMNKTRSRRCLRRILHTRMNHCNRSYSHSHSHSHHNPWFPTKNYLLTSNSSC